MQPNYEETFTFLKKHSPKNHWVLVGISPEDRSIVGASFDVNQQKETIHWLETRNQQQRLNVYFCVNPTIKPIMKKPKRTDIARVTHLHLDLDPAPMPNDFEGTKEAWIDDEQQRIYGVLTSARPEPTTVLFSGGGYQAFWKLEIPIEIDGDVEAAEEARLYNMGLEQRYGGDQCHNIDRVMRLPGTINWPDAKKRKKGREPCLSSIIWHNDNVYELSQFVPGVTKTTKKSSAKDRAAQQEKLTNAALNRNMPASLKYIIKNGEDPDKPDRWDGDRSAMVWFVTCEMFRYSASEEQVVSVLTNPLLRISGHVLDQNDPEDYARRQWARAEENAVDPKLVELNDRHAILLEKGMILTEKPGHPPIIQSRADFHLRYMNRYVEVPEGDGTKIKKIDLAQWWLRHPQRREYEDMHYAPFDKDPRRYNRWCGFAVEPKEGDCSMFLEHAKDVICAGNDDHFEYLVRWMAHCIQNPHRLGEVAVVIHGDQGTGKSLFCKEICHIFGLGKHAISVANVEHVVGRFNAHLSQCSLLLIEEANFTRDKKSIPILKTLVTESDMAIEMKYQDLTYGKNHMHVMMTSNDTWVVPAEINERRFFVLRASSTHRQNPKYFARFVKTMEEGGREALLQFLMKVDLTNFNIRIFPHSDSLQTQKMQSLSVEQAWWYEKLDSGELFEGEVWPDNKNLHAWCKHVRSSFIAHTRRWGSKERISQQKLNQYLRTFMPSGVAERRRLTKSVDHKNPETGEMERLDRPHYYRLPTLRECREWWDRNFGGPYEWVAPEGIQEELPIWKKKRPRPKNPELPPLIPLELPPAMKEREEERKRQEEEKKAKEMANPDIPTS